MFVCLATMLCKFLNQQTSPMSNYISPARQRNIWPRVNASTEEQKQRGPKGREQSRSKLHTSSSIDPWKMLILFWPCRHCRNRCLTLIHLWTGWSVIFPIQQKLSNHKRSKAPPRHVAGGRGKGRTTQRRDRGERVSVTPSAKRKESLKARLNLLWPD